MTNRIGTSIYSITRGAKKLGLESMTIEADMVSLKNSSVFPCILLWNQNHFVVLRGVKHKRSWKFPGSKSTVDSYWEIADPAFGIVHLSDADFRRKWCGTDKTGIAVVLEPSDDFDSISDSFELGIPPRNAYRSQIKDLLLTHKGALSQIIFGMVLSSLVFLAFPVLTQRLVDVGIKYQSRDFIMLILLFQLGLFLSVIIIDALKALLLLRVGSKMEINLTYDFLSKLMKMPMYYFETKVTGDLMQRISDNNRIQVFIKNELLEFLIAITNIVALLLLMISYSIPLAVLYISGSLFSIIWAVYFIKKRELLDYRRFDVNTENADNLIETIVAMPEIKVNTAQDIKKDKWKEIQGKLFAINEKIVRLQLYQNSGSNALNQLKNITITFFSAILVISNKLSIGEMMGVSFIIGQLNLPLMQVSQFFQSSLDARISFTRMSEIQDREEEDHHLQTEITKDIHAYEGIISGFNKLHVNNVSFSYTEDKEDLLFENLSFDIERGKTTAIVGTSGSGKTTLIKLLLKYYKPLDGSITIDNTDLTLIPADRWRENCGVVLQEGHIFSDTIAHNICLSEREINKQKLEDSARLACIDDFIESLPLGYKTKVGNSGIGLSAGQKQRILIARAVYKNPSIIIFDEATSSLDANNELQIKKNMDLFLQDRTAIIVAHRLSTVKNAHKIIVLEKGKIVEYGSHEELIRLKKNYFNLIKNQLELGS